MGAAHAGAARPGADAGPPGDSARGDRRPRADTRSARTWPIRPSGGHGRVLDRILRRRCDRIAGPSRHRRSRGGRHLARRERHARDRACGTATSARHDHRDAGAGERLGLVGDRLRTAPRRPSLRRATDATAVSGTSPDPAAARAVLGQRGARCCPPGAAPERGAAARACSSVISPRTARSGAR